MAVKKIFDRAAAGAGLIVTAPVMAASAIAIRLTMGAPVLFRQRRPGLHGRPFELLKFRTMSNDVDGQGELLPDIARLTPLGRFLRTTSMDELPQLWNVAKGELSIIGPRPLKIEYLERYNADQARRHDVLPGISGWAQVNGRNQLTWDQKFALDGWYVDNWSLALDLKVLGKTIVRLLRTDGISAPGHTTMPDFLGNVQQQVTPEHGAHPSTSSEEHATRRRPTSRAHYDRFPYDVGIRGGEVYVARKGPLGSFLDSISEGTVLDLGCGPGNLLGALGRRASRTVAVDVSRNSLRRAAAATSDLRVSPLQADALNLPFGDEVFDFVLATGSLHHTGDAPAAFREMFRVLSPGGRAFISIYASGSYYDRLYHTVGAAARAAESTLLSRWVVNRCLLLPLFVAYLWSGRALVHRRLSPPGIDHVRNYFADQLLNPVVSFHDESEVQRWASLVNADLIQVSPSHAGALLNISFVKRGRSGGP